MTSVYYVDNETNRIIGGCMTNNEDSARMQPQREGTTQFILPDQLIFDPYSTSPDYSQLKAYLCKQIDDACASQLSAFAELHRKKRAEAEEWQPGESATGFPFLNAEWAARQVLGESVDFQEVRNSVLERAEASDLALAGMEAMRVATKAAINRAQNLPDIFAASQAPAQ